MCPFHSFQLCWKQRRAAGNLKYFCFLLQETTNLSSCLQCSYTYRSAASAAGLQDGVAVCICRTLASVPNTNRPWRDRPFEGAPLWCCLAALPGHPLQLLTSSVYVYVCACICTKEKGRGDSFPRGGAAGPLGVSVATRSAAPARGQGTAAALASVAQCRHGASRASLRVGQGWARKGCTATALLLPEQDFDNLAARRFAQEEIVLLVWPCCVRGVHLRVVWSSSRMGRYSHLCSQKLIPCVGLLETTNKYSVSTFTFPDKNEVVWPEAETFTGSSIWC